MTELEYPDKLITFERPYPSEFLVELDHAIPLALLAAQRAEGGYVDPAGPHRVSPYWVVLDRLIQIRTQILSSTIPSAAQRMAQGLRQTMNDGWDIGSPYLSYMGGIMFLYEHKLVLDGTPLPPPSVEVDRIVAERAELRERQRVAEPLPVPDPAARLMPHHPDPKSLRRYQVFALQIRNERQQSTDLSARDRFSLGSQHAIGAYVGHWLQEDPRQCVGDLRTACSLRWIAIGAGYPAHIWDLEQLFVDAVAVQSDQVAEAVIARKEDDWNLAQTRPVPWLTARLRCMFLLQRRSKVAIGALFEDFRLAVFVDVLPPELQPHKPLIQNSYRLLMAVREQAWPSLEQRLAERMELLVKHYWRNIAPAALADTFGLSVVRWARERGHHVQIRHAYLPLEWLDVPVATA